MAAFEETVDPEFLRRLRAFVRRRVPSEHDADDVVQDALVKLLHKGASVSPGAARAWLFTVARHQIHDRWRARRPEALADVEPVAPAPEEESETVAYLARCMEPMLTSMAEEDRQLILRVDVRGESQADVARALGMPSSSFKSRVQRARRRLRGILEACCTVERDRLGTPVAHARRPERPCPCSPPDGSGRRAASGCAPAAGEHARAGGASTAGRKRRGTRRSAQAPVADA